MPLISKLFLQCFNKEILILILFLKLIKGAGGTDLNWNGNAISSITNWQSETAWSCTSYSSCNNNGGSNGGYSTYYTRPAYQNGVQSNAYRGVPDVSANSFPNSGFEVCFNGASGTYGSGYSCILVGGKQIFLFIFSELTIIKSSSLKYLENALCDIFYHTLYFLNQK